MHGALIPDRRGILVWASDPNNPDKLSGYISRSGGFTKKANDARVFEGVGMAIRIAQVYKVAIMSW